MGIDEVGIDKVGIDKVGRYLLLWLGIALFPRLSPHCNEKSEGEPENEVHKGHFSPLHKWA